MESSERGELSLHDRDSDTDDESLEPASKKKKTKFTGSFMYKTRFSGEAGKQGFLYQMGAIKGCAKGCKKSYKTL